MFFQKLNRVHKYLLLINTIRTHQTIAHEILPLLTHSGQNIASTLNNVKFFRGWPLIAAKRSFGI